MAKAKKGPHDWINKTLHAGPRSAEHADRLTWPGLYLLSGKPRVSLCPSKHSIHCWLTQTMHGPVSARTNVRQASACRKVSHYGAHRSRTRQVPASTMGFSVGLGGLALHLVHQLVTAINHQQFLFNTSRVARPNFAIAIFPDTESRLACQMPPQNLRLAV